MDSCIFCDIVVGRIDSARVCEDEVILAFMDQRQAHPGHVLVIPKDHYPDIYSLPADSGSALMGCVIRVCRAVRQTFEAPGLNIWQSNGECAGQEVSHVHFHVHPRYPDDGVLKGYSVTPGVTPLSTLEEYASQIAGHLR